MTQGTIWSEPGTELHYLLNNQETFIKVYSEDQYVLYEVRKL